MPRNVTPEVLTALRSSLLRPAVFVLATFGAETVYVWSGIGDISWNSHTWKGVGSLGSVSTIEDGSTVEARGTVISLSGLNAALVASVLGDYRVGLPVFIYLGFFDAGGDLIPDPIVTFAGRMDQPTITVGGDTLTIAISCENRLLDMNTSVERRYTNEDQRIDYPTDRGFEYVNSIQDLLINWGRLPSKT